MIRPITVVTFLMACGSGLYLYQSKHEVQVLDRTIEKTVHETGALREQSRLLAAEWTMLNDPERLRQFSDTYLNLKSINPAQFTSLTELGNRLPPIKVEAPAPAPASDDALPTPVSEVPSGSVQGAVTEQDRLPVPPVPVMSVAPAVVAAARTAETKVVAVRPVVAIAPVRPAAIAEAKPSESRPYEQRAPEQRTSEQRTSEQRVAPRIAEAHPEMRAQPAPPLSRPIVLAAPRPSLPSNTPSYSPPPSAPVQVPYGGSLLGMAHGSMPPAPRPTPVNATYNAN